MSAIFTINVDSAPLTEVLYPESGGVNPSPVTINLIGTDSIIAYVCYDGNPVVGDPSTETLPLPSTITLLDQGIYQIKYMGVDGLGNYTPIKTIIVGVDRPFTVYTITPTLGSTNGGDLIFIKGQAFSTSVEVLIDGQVVPSQAGSDDGTWIARTLMHAAGTVNITVNDILLGVSETFYQAFTFVNIIPENIDPLWQEGQVNQYIFDTTAGILTMNYELYPDYDVDKMVEIMTISSMTQAMLALHFGSIPQNIVRSF